MKKEKKIIWLLTGIAAVSLYNPQIQMFDGF